MNPNLLSRLRSLLFCDKLMLLFAIACMIVGIPHNYFRVRGLTNTAAWLFCTLLFVLLEAAIAGVAAYSLIRQHRTLAVYGFSFRRGGMASVAILALSHVYLVASGKFVLSANPHLPWIVVAVLMEEFVVRVVLIDRFMLLMEGMKGKAFWAILASSVLWSIAHIPSTPLSQVIGGIFLGGLLLGYIYYKSRSILLPAWIHGVANGGYVAGVVITLLYCLLAVADWIIASRMKQTSQTVVASTNT